MDVHNEGFGSPRAVFVPDVDEERVVGCLVLGQLVDSLVAVIGHRVGIGAVRAEFQKAVGAVDCSCARIILPGGVIVVAGIPKIGGREFGGAVGIGFRHMRRADLEDGVVVDVGDGELAIGVEGAARILGVFVAVVIGVVIGVVDERILIHAAYAVFHDR